jgi:hypothetical protein
MRAFKLQPRIRIRELRQAMLEGRLREIPGLRIPEDFIPCNAVAEHQEPEVENASPAAAATAAQ